MPQPADMLPRVPARGGEFWFTLQHPLVRMMLFFLAAVGAWIATSYAVSVWVQRTGQPPHSNTPLIVFVVSSALILLTVYALMVWLVERRSLREFALRRFPVRAGLGLVIGLALVTTQVGLLWLAGGYVVEDVNGPGNLGKWALAALAVSIVEELLMRGIAFRLMEEWAGSWIALAFSAVLFGLLHVGNSGMTLWTFTALTLEAGILLGAMFMASRTLWMPIALHAAWNFTMGGLFGLAVSGGRPPGLLVAHTHGPWWVTGGAFGLEASLPTVVMCLALAGIFLWQARQRGRIMPMGWARRNEGGTPTEEPQPEARA